MNGSFPGFFLAYGTKNELFDLEADFVRGLLFFYLKNLFNII